MSSATTTFPSSNSIGNPSGIAIPQEFVCPLTLEIMEEPAMTRYGHNFEITALLKWLEDHEDCPLTRKPLGLRDILLNSVLQRRIYFWKKQTPTDSPVLPGCFW